jgi:DNA ligase-1
MKAFAALYAELDASTSTARKVDAMQRYFASAPPADAAWAAYFLAGGKPRQTVPTAVMVGTACDAAGIEPWLFDACYQAVGDLAETIAHILPLRADDNTPDDAGLAEWIEQRLMPLRGQPPPLQAQALQRWWQALDDNQAFLLIKLIGGAFRVGVSKLLVQRALAAHAGIDAKRVAQRMMGYTDGRVTPSPERYLQLTAEAEAAPLDLGQPYPFFLAHSLELPLEELAARLAATADWIVEWKYDGIRAQVVKRASQVWIWSRGEELVTERFPELVAAAAALPNGTVLDGEIVVWTDGRVAPFALLQQRIGRKTLTKKVLAEAPVGFIAYDLLELGGVDLRELSQAERRDRLEALLAGQEAIRLSPIETRASWPEFAALREEARTRGVEGLMLKHRSARYGTGRRKQDDLAGGTWWKWKIEPLSVDCILVYAQAGHGRRASVYTDYTFAVWSRTPRDAAEAEAALAAIARKDPAAPDALQLVPFAKAYSGLTDAEFRTVDKVIRSTTIEKFGPVRSVRPTLLFELGFEGINRSGRHRSGIAVRFPRMLRLRTDKPLHEADTLASLEALLALQQNASSPRSHRGT